MSITNTVLQYCLLATIFYLYAKVPMLGGNHGKKQHSAFSAFSQLNISRVFGGTEVKPKKVAASNADTPTKDQPMSQDLSQSAQLQHPSTPPSSSSPSSKRKALKRSGSSRTNLHEQSRVLGRRLVLRPSASSKSSENRDPSSPSSNTPFSGEEEPPSSNSHGVQSSASASRSPIQESHRRFLKEAFSNVPMMEIDRKIKAANWDLSEAAAMLAREDYTWQSVPRRRSIHM
ncbi:hypothetical protein DFQ27_007062 [Actinomortierella ambigua]|uniref:Uncharacterized protein n=1 Tax=Actinomortierella ambigua TaxID=1343610 RepID=A0A9P6PUQ4_9FUNG|nr:hypothetical protein DFQ27_007062 [Actinomortierella ambigua]